jgi:hypothetical protein
MTLSRTPPKLPSQLNVWRREWRQVLSEQQNHRCCWCGTRMCEAQGTPDSATIEHITPLSKGGEDRPHNFAVACAYCNHRRGSMTVDTFMKIAVECRTSADRRLRVQKQMKELGYHFSRCKPGKAQRKLEQVEARIAWLQGKPNPFPQGTRAYCIYERYKLKAVA